MFLPPAEYVIHRFGGVRATARAIGITPAAVTQWRIGTSGSGQGKIPGSSMESILEAARRLDVDITAEDLIKGRRVAFKRGHGHIIRGVNT